MIGCFAVKKDGLGLTLRISIPHVRIRSKKFQRDTAESSGKGLSK